MAAWQGLQTREPQRQEKPPRGGATKDLSGNQDYRTGRIFFFNGGLDNGINLGKSLRDHPYIARIYCS